MLLLLELKTNETIKAYEQSKLMHGKFMFNLKKQETKISNLQKLHQREQLLCT